jgi:hypothetical protein
MSTRGAATALPLLESAPASPLLAAVQIEGWALVLIFEYAGVFLEAGGSSTCSANWFRLEKGMLPANRFRSEKGMLLPARAASPPGTGLASDRRGCASIFDSLRAILGWYAPAEAETLLCAFFPAPLAALIRDYFLIDMRWRALEWPRHVVTLPTLHAERRAVTLQPWGSTTRQYVSGDRALQTGAGLLLIWAVPTSGFDLGVAPLYRDEPLPAPACDEPLAAPVRGHGGGDSPTDPSTSMGDSHPFYGDAIESGGDVFVSIPKIWRRMHKPPHRAWPETIEMGAVGDHRFHVSAAAIELQNGDALISLADDAGRWFCCRRVLSPAVAALGFPVTVAASSHYLVAQNTLSISSFVSPDLDPSASPVLHDPPRLPT